MGKTKKITSMLLLAFVCVSLIGMLVCNPISDGCSCVLSQRQYQHIFHDGHSRTVDQRHCMLEIRDFSRYEELLEMASDCCCMATYEVETPNHHLSYRRVDGCNVVAC